jgi:hypothetical protein
MCVDRAVYDYGCRTREERQKPELGKMDP